MAGTWLVILEFCILAIRYFGQEYAGVALRVELLFYLGNFRFVIGTWTRVISWRELLVFNVYGGLENLTSLF